MKASFVVGLVGLAASASAAGLAPGPLRARRLGGSPPPLVARRDSVGTERPLSPPPPLSLLRFRGGGEGVMDMAAGKAWTILFGATAFELVSTYFMHLAKGFSVPGPAALAVLFYGASFYAFNLSLRGIELSIAYAVWSAVVMAALSAIGMSFLGERVSAGKVAGILAIMFGTILLSAEMTE